MKSIFKIRIITSYIASDMRGRGHDPGQNLLVSDVGWEERTTVMRLLRPVGFATLAAYIWIALHEALYAQAAPAAL